MSQSSQYVGLDVSLKETAICVIDEAGAIAWRGKVDSTPEAISKAVKQHAPMRFGSGSKADSYRAGCFMRSKTLGSLSFASMRVTPRRRCR